MESGYLIETDASHVYSSYTYLLTQYEQNDYVDSSSKPILLPNAKALSVLWENNSNRYTHVLLNTYDSAVLVPEDADEDWQPSDGEMQSYPVAILGQRLTYDGTTPLDPYLAVFGSMDMTNSAFTSMSALNNSANAAVVELAQLPHR